MSGSPMTGGLRRILTERRIADRDEVKVFGFHELLRHFIQNGDTLFNGVRRIVLRSEIIAGFKDLVFPAQKK
jgi:hypothetical protein